MTSIGEIEKKTQARIVALFCTTLGYTYLGNWIDRPNNRNIEADRLRTWLTGRAVSAEMITRTLYQLVGDPKSGHLQAVSVKLGITDGITTEVIDGLNEKDVIVTAVLLPGVKASASPANPFNAGGGPGGRRGF